jgi:hypothetical protein
VRREFSHGDARALDADLMKVWQILPRRFLDQRRKRSAGGGGGEICVSVAVFAFDGDEEAPGLDLPAVNANGFDPRRVGGNGAQGFAVDRLANLLERERFHL